MRSLSMAGAAVAAARDALDLTRIARWARIGTTAVATVVAVLLASYVAVTLGLS